MKPPEIAVSRGKQHVWAPLCGQAVQGEERVTTLERLMAIDPRLWRQVRHECHLLLIQGMLMDIESKKYFAEVSLVVCCSPLRFVCLFTLFWAPGYK